MTGRVVLHRGGGWTDRLRAYRILVNGEACARLRRKSSVMLELDAGRHKITAEIDWCGSNALMVDLVGGDTVEIDVRNPHGPFRGQSVMTSAPDRYLLLSIR